MESLQAAYAYNEDDDAREAPTSPPQTTATPDGGVTGATLSSPVVVADLKPDLPQNDQVDAIKEEIGTAASKDVLSKEYSFGGISKAIDAHQIDQRDSQISSNLPPETDAGLKRGEGEEEEEPPLKKQKQLPDLPKATTPKLEITEMPLPSIPSQARSGKPPTGKKPKKKKSKDVWATNSRKGKKKTKQASNYNLPFRNNVPLTEDKALRNSILIYPHRNDDSPDLKICLSKIFKAEKVELSEDRLTASSTKGFRMVRATRGVTHGAWYFEIRVVHLGETGHTRLGWSTEKGDLQAPVGFDANSYGYRDIDGSKVNKALREMYGDEGYKQGDVIGFYISLPDGGSYLPNPQNLVSHRGQDPPTVVPGSEISYFKNGVCQGVAFRDIYAGCYYPAASMYTLPNQPTCVVKFNFGPDFGKFPEDFGERPVPRPMIEVPYQSVDGRAENGRTWNITIMFPVLKVIKGENRKFMTATEMGG